MQVTAELTGVDLPAPTTIINTQAIENLPINGRRFTDFAALTPTVQINPQRGSISFAGQRGIYGNVMVDGADYNNPFFGGTRGGERSNFVPTIPQIVGAGVSGDRHRLLGRVRALHRRLAERDFQIRRQRDARRSVLPDAAAGGLHGESAGRDGASDAQRYRWARRANSSSSSAEARAAR